MALLPSRLSTETPFFQDLIADIKRGQIKIPQFQRKFVWKEEQAFKLLDSIKNNYPIGSLLVWKTNVKLAAERNIGNFQLPQTDDMMPTDYVLDGQQRITVIYSSIGAPDNVGGFSPGFDLRAESFVLMDEVSGVTVFPLRWIYDTTKMLNFRLLSRICGEIPVRGAAPSCDKGQFPWLRRCESHRIVWSPLGFCCRSEEHTSA